MVITGSFTPVIDFDFTLELQNNTCYTIDADGFIKFELNGIEYNFHPSLVEQYSDEILAIEKELKIVLL